jgi:hypothetical protein
MAQLQGIHAGEFITRIPFVYEAATGDIAAGEHQRSKKAKELWRSR